MERPFSLKLFLFIVNPGSLDSAKMNFWSGVYNYTVSYPLAKEYFDRLDAPIKKFYSFEKSAHSPLFEEPEKMQKILKGDVLKSENNLADRQ